MSGVLSEHFEHSAGHEESTKNVDGCDGCGGEGKGGDEPVGASKLQERSDEDDSGDRVGLRHQRGVQRVADAVNNVETDDHGEHEHGEVHRESGCGERYGRNE